MILEISGVWHCYHVTASRSLRLSFLLCKVFCSVPDLKGAVQEVKRVLKPGGKLLYWDHVYADRSRTLLRLGQNVLNPLQQALADGCHLNRYPSNQPYDAL